MLHSTPAFLKPLSNGSLVPAFRLILNAPQRRNALGQEMVECLRECVQQLTAMAPWECRGVIMESQVEGTFCAGADLKERHTQTPRDILRFSDNVRGIIDGIARLPCPVVAAIDGAALGGGLELALGADIRVASPQARFGFPEAGLGIIPGVGGTQRATRLIGTSRTKLLIFTGRRIDASLAQEWGLVDVVSVDAKKAAEDILQEALSKAPLALLNAKAAVDEGQDVALGTGLAFERAYYSRLFHTQDRLEGLAAFNEKRAPRWQCK
eukprot:jgi/Botrbrau1/15783/Bobra.4_1s0135.1